MKKELTLTLSPLEASDKKYYMPVAAKLLGVDSSEITSLIVRRRSVDARQRQIKINMSVEVWVGEMPVAFTAAFEYGNVAGKPPVAIVGAGPAGLFAALRLIELGYKPVIFERGRKVSERKRDIADIYRCHIINPDSNYGFGEGGAGAFSDGKLYTRSKKRGNVQRMLEVFVHFGASSDILIDAHPHIGSDKLPAVITNMRKQILASGGEIHFDSRVTDILTDGNRCRGLALAGGVMLDFDTVILATGHSARDIYEMMWSKGIELEAKSFAMGVRIEHPQLLIDSIQYHCAAKDPLLPAAEYFFAGQVDGRGVYTFCMCPGGFIVPAATAPGEMVVNGMSAAARNSPFANAGLVVEVHPQDLQEFSPYGVLAGIKFRQSLERACFEINGNTQNAPAQRITDFVEGNGSASLPASSYRPGLVQAALHEALPPGMAKRLRAGILQIDGKARGFHTAEGIVAGIESRTSSPVRMPRDKDTLQHIQVAGLYPCGEGAGYAGGITSSAIDGYRCAEAIATARTAVHKF